MPDLKHRVVNNFLFAALALGLGASCSQPIQTLSDDLAGTWNSENALRTYIFSRSGTVTLTVPDSELNVVTMPRHWAASTSYALGDYVGPTLATQQAFVCTKAGTSGSTEPTWNTSSMTADGTAEWAYSSTYSERGTWSLSDYTLTLSWPYRKPSPESYSVFELSSSRIRLTSTSGLAMDLLRQ